MDRGNGRCIMAWKSKAMSKVSAYSRENKSDVFLIVEVVQYNQPVTRWLTHPRVGNGESVC